MRFVRIAGACAVSIAIVVSGRPRVAAQAQGSRAIDPPLVAALKWRSIGPANTGGRVDDFAVARVPGAPDTIYVGTASGGIFRSTNQGTTWTPVFDRVDAMMSIGDLAVAPSNPAIVWAGTGEANNRQSSSWGDGVYKSTDSGATWRSVGLRDTHHIGRIVVHPSNPDVVYVAAVGHLWGSNAERGVFKTTDGGQTWTKALFVDENTGATDLVIDPRNPETLYAAMYQRQRRTWGFNGGGPGSGIYRSRDGGRTWSRLVQGLPKGDIGRIGLDASSVDAGVVYATIEAAGRDGGIFRSSNGGDTWEQLSSVNPRPMYYSQIRLDPKDRNRVYLLGSNRGFYISDDGGRNFRDVFSTVHSEDHALWIDPDDPNHLLVGGDGGVSISWDRGVTWQFRDNLPIGQFYEISADNQDPYSICGGLQDNGHWCTPSATRTRIGISNRDAFNIGSGDGFHARIDPSDPRIVIVESQDGRANRVDITTLERQAISPLSPERMRPGERERWNWDTPIAVSSFDPKVIYMGSNVVFRSPDRGVTWRAISPDLTAHIDRETLTMMGSKVPERALSRHDGQTSFSTLTTISESPLDAKVLYTGSDDGQLQVTRDGGQTWSNVSARVPGLPPHTYVSSVLPSRHAAGRVYATFDNHREDDFTPYVYASDDFGQSWRTIVSGLPQTSVHRLREHPRVASLLFVGHERGIHASVDGGATWSSLNLNMPNVPVDDLLIHPRENDLIVGTHGRSLWVLDNIAPLEALATGAAMRDAYLLPPARARQLTLYNPQAWFGAGQFFAPNPDAGAIIDFYLREAPAEEAQLSFSDASNHVVRTMRVTPRRGLNRVSWDLRMDPPLGDPPADAAPNAFGGPALGPGVLPGTYTVSLKVPRVGRDLKAALEIASDPRVTVSEADQRVRMTALLKLYELQRTLGRARLSARDGASRSDAQDRTGGPRSGDGTAKLLQLQNDIGSQLNTINALARAIDTYSGAPTADQQRQISWAQDDVSRIVMELSRITGSR
jgi:photosystem II stability/assembly factor-like uncharacterized protein